MSSESLSSVIIDLLDNQHKVGRAVVGLYRRGGTKLLDQSLPESLGNRGRQVKDVLESVIVKASDGADVALDKLYGNTAKAVGKLATKVDGVGVRYAPICLNLARQITLPGALIARKVSATLASTAGKIYPIKAGKTTAKPTRKTAKKTRKSY
jgi:hypothetical protein